MTAPGLSYSRVTADGASPARWMILLHGVFGMGGNLRTLARQVAARLPDWGVILPDLRGHGRTEALPPPHTVAAAAEDVARLEAALGHPVQALGGHSFGGKVALARLAAGAPDLEHFVLLDSMVGARPSRMLEDQAGQVLAMLEQLPWPLPTREAFLREVQARGYPRPIAEWLAMNLTQRRAAAPDARDDRNPEGVSLRLDLPAIRSMLADYFSLDAWPTLEQPPRPVRTLFVVGGRSTVVTPTDRERLAHLAAGSSEFQLHVLEDAGHWVHVDDPEGVVDVLVRHLERRPV